MRKTNLIIYWLILIIATAMIGCVAFWLLDSEQKQIKFFTDDLARARANAVVTNINHITSRMKGNMMEMLKRLPAWDVYEMLPILNEDNPLIDEVFYWIPEHGLVLPEVETNYDMALSTMFKDNKFIGNEIIAELKIPLSNKYKQRDSKIRKKSPTKNMFKYLKENNKNANFGWIPLRTEGVTLFIGWYRTSTEGSLRGVILNMEVLAEELIAAFPEKLMLGEYMSIQNDNGVIIHEYGSAKGGEETLYVGRELPNWKLAYSYSKRGIFTKGFFMLGTLLILILVVAIVVGGSLLLRQAQINSTDAAKKTTFVSNVSHELKTPLTSIRLYSEMLGKGNIQDPEKQKNYLQTIIIESERLTRLVNNVLDFSRLERGKKHYNTEKRDLCELVHHVVEMQRIRIEGAGMLLEYNIPENAVEHSIDPDAIEQILINLIDNAIKYASSGKHLKISIETKDDKISILVTDKGPGIPPEHRSNIFKMFHRVDNSLTSNQPGCGLGLSISKKLVEDMGGILDIKNKDDQKQGTCFIITFNSNV